MLNWIFKFLLGDDIFISYSRADGATYAAGLANELTRLKFSCKIDQWGTQAGAEMPESLKKSLKRSAVLVLIGTEGAAKSKHVASEIAEFKRTGRMIVPIIFDGILLKNGLTYLDGVKQQIDSKTSALAETEATWAAGIEGLPISWEKLENLKTGNPSPENVSRIEKTFTFSRKDERLRKTSLAAAIFLLLLLAASAAASVVAFVQTKNAAVATNLAAEKEQIANQKTKEAENAAEKANFESERALKNEEIANQKTEEARVKTEEAEKATKRAEEEKAKADKASKLAVEKTKLADEKTKLADAAQNEAEKQTKRAEEKRIEAEKLGVKSRNLSYATNIQLAARLYDSGQLESFANVLSGTDENLRGFEWYYLKHLPEGTVKFDKTGEWEISRIMFAPNGEYFATKGMRSSSKGMIDSLLLWNAKNGEKRELEIDEKLKDKENIDIIFSPKGERFAAVFKKDILIWDTENRERIRISNEANADEKFKLITFGEDIDELLTVGIGKEAKYILRRWNIKTRAQVGDSQEIKPETELYFDVLKLLPDGKTFVRYQESEEDPNSQLSLLDTNLKETKVYKETAENETYFSYDYYFSPTGERLAVIKDRLSDDGEIDSKVFILNITGDKVSMSSPLLEGNAETGNVRSVVFSPDEKKIAASYSNQVKIWDTGKNKTETVLPFSSSGTIILAFSPDSSKLAVVSDTLTLWNVNSKQDVFTFNNETVLGISPDGAWAITASPKADSASLWNTAENKLVRKFSAEGNEFGERLFASDTEQEIEVTLINVKFSPDGKRFVILREDSEFPMRLLNTANEDEIKLMSDTGCELSFVEEHVMFSENGKRIAAVCKDGTIRVWNIENQNGTIVRKELSKLQTEKSLLKFFEELSSRHFGIRFVEEAEKIVLLLDDDITSARNIQLWDAEGGTLLNSEICSEKISEISPTGEWMVTRDDKNNYRLRNKDNKRCDEKTLSSGDKIKDIVFSNDSKTLAINYDDKLIWVGNLTNKTVREVIPLQKKDYSIEFSPSGRWLGTGDKYWNTETGENFTIHGCTRNPQFSVDENRLITTCDDGTLKFWSMDSGQEVLSLKAHDRYVRNMVLLEGNKYLLTASSDNLKVWRLKLWRTQF